MSRSPRDPVGWMDRHTCLSSCNSLCVHESQNCLPDEKRYLTQVYWRTETLNWTTASLMICPQLAFSIISVFNRWKPSAETLTGSAGFRSWRHIEDSARAASMFGEVFSVADRRWIKRWISDLLAAAVTLVRWITTSHLWPHLQACISAQSRCVLVFVGSGADQL